MSHRHLLSSTALALTSLLSPGSSSSAYAISIEDIANAIEEGDANFSFRYRYEFVDQDSFEENAAASTLKSRFSWNSAANDGWRFGLEADYVSIVGSERYNSTGNGEIRYPVVADPEGFDLNQAFIAYDSDSFGVTGGRQRIVQDDERFVGGVGWRQNEQTYDAMRLTLSPVGNIVLDYSYLANVNRIFGPNDGAQPADWQSNSHLLNASFKVSANHTFRAFSHLLDFDNDNGVPESTATHGIGYTGQLGPLTIAAAIARQSDYADSPLNYAADYVGISGAFKLEPLSLTAGFERLGSDDGLASFRTPLATLHKFQGWADKFLATPATGIEDLYFGIAGAIGPVNLAGTWHDFNADQGGADYGTEIDIVASYAVSKQVSLQLKFADYDADEFATNTTKVWLSVILNL